MAKILTVKQEQVKYDLAVALLEAKELRSELFPATETETSRMVCSKQADAMNSKAFRLETIIEKLINIQIDLGLEG